MRNLHMKEVELKRPNAPPKITYEPMLRAETCVTERATGAELWVPGDVSEDDRYAPVMRPVVYARKAKLDDFGNVLSPAVEAQYAVKRRVSPAWCADGEEPTLTRLDGSVVPWADRDLPPGAVTYIS